MKNKGFSLVELIVVIAIMAILVGVAVPVYSSYVEKAQMEADRQLVSEIKHAIEIANAADPFEGTVTIVLTNEGFDVVGGDNGALAAEAQRIEEILNTQISGDLKLKYSGWGNGVAATVSMLDVLFTGDLESTMAGLLGNPGKLSFTEQIPELMDEIRNVAVDVTRRVNADAEPADEDVIALVQSAAGTTSGLSLNAVQALWKSNIEFKNNDYVLPDYAVFEDQNIDMLSVAALVRAQNTCVALYLQNNWPVDLGVPCPANLYSVVSACSQKTVTGSGSDIFPYDVTAVRGNATQMGNLLTAAGIDPTNTAVTGKLIEMLEAYFASPVSDNDAAAYYAMMKTVDETKEELSKDSLNEYFEDVAVPVKVFQDLVSGKLNKDALANVEDNYGDNNITITVAGDGEKLTFVIGPSNVLE